MSKEGSDHGTANWFAERDAARSAGGAAPEGASPALNPQAGDATNEAVNPQEPDGRNTGNRDIGQYSGQGVPARTKK